MAPVPMIPVPRAISTAPVPVRRATRTAPAPEIVALEVVSFAYCRLAKACLPTGVLALSRESANARMRVKILR